jgi:NAD(P)-dependent dehydrogenase (short-subunit alcohol dehydrogenase family)
MSDLFSLAGKTALVTGSSRGIGRAIALGFAAQGAEVAVHYSGSKADAQSAVEQATAFGSKAHMFAANFSEPNAARILFSQVVQVFGKLDILVLNVSVQVRRPWTEVTHSEFDLQVNTNLRASMEMMQLAIPGMVERRWGRVLTIGSVQQFRAHPEMLVYAATKSAQLNMAMNIGRQVAPHGVTVNNLCPGTIETDRNSEALADAAYRSRVLSHIPMQLFGQPEDCVGAALLLCSDAGRFITGIDLIVDGGFHLE